MNDLKHLEFVLRLERAEHDITQRALARVKTDLETVSLRALSLESKRGTLEAEAEVARLREALSFVVIRLDGKPNRTRGEWEADRVLARDRARTALGSPSLGTPLPPPAEQVKGPAREWAVRIRGDGIKYLADYEGTPWGYDDRATAQGRADTYGGWVVDYPHDEVAKSNAFKRGTILPVDAPQSDLRGQMAGHATESRPAMSETVNLTLAQERTRDITELRQAFDKARR